MAHGNLVHLVSFRRNRVFGRPTWNRQGPSNIVRLAATRPMVVTRGRKASATADKCEEKDKLVVDVAELLSSDCSAATSRPYERLAGFDGPR